MSSNTWKQEEEHHTNSFSNSASVWFTQASQRWNATEINFIDEQLRNEAISMNSLKDMFQLINNLAWIHGYPMKMINSHG